MPGTLTAIIALLGIYLLPQYGFASGQDISARAAMQHLYLLPFSLLILQAFMWLISLLALQRTEEKIVPRIFTLLAEDKYLRRTNAGLFCLLIILFFTALSSAYFSNMPSQILISSAILILGICFDLFYLLLKSIYAYLNPSAVLQMISKRSQTSIAKGEEASLCDWLDSLSEIALKALARNNYSLCIEALQESSNLMHANLNSSTKKLDETNSQDPNFITSEEKARFTLFFLFDRWETIYLKAQELQLESVCSMFITLLGKMAVHAAEYKIELASHPIQQLGKFSLAEKNMPNLILKGTGALIELCKTMAGKVDANLPNFKEPFFSAIAELDLLAKENFRKDKSTNIKLLTYPFLDLKAFFQKDDRRARSNSDEIIKELDRILAEWDTLETVMRMVPRGASS